MKRFATLAFTLFILTVLTGQSCNFNVFNLSQPADGGVFKSKDGGDTWTQISKIDEKNTISKVNISTLTIDPRNVDTIFAGATDGRLYKTEDGGKAWKRLVIPSGRIKRIVIKPDDSNVLYVSGSGGGYGKILKSIDGGETWVDTYTDPVAKQTISALDIDPSSPNTLYASTGSNGIIKTTDGGDTWRLLEWSEGHVDSLLVDPRRTQRFYISTTDNGLYRSENGGNSIEHLTIDKQKFPGANKISDLAIDPNSSDTLYLASQFGLLKSTDAGNSWNEVNILIPKSALPVKTVAIDPARPNVVFVSTSNTVYKSSDGGNTWVVKSLPTTRAISTLAINPSNTDFIYLGLIYQK